MQLLHLLNLIKPELLRLQFLYKIYDATSYIGVPLDLNKSNKMTEKLFIHTTFAVWSSGKPVILAFKTCEVLQKWLLNVEKVPAESATNLLFLSKELPQ